MAKTVKKVHYLVASKDGLVRSCNSKIKCGTENNYDSKVGTLAASKVTCKSCERTEDYQHTQSIGVEVEEIIKKSEKAEKVLGQADAILEIAEKSKTVSKDEDGVVVVKTEDIEPQKKKWWQFWK